MFTVDHTYVLPKGGAYCYTSEQEYFCQNIFSFGYEFAELFEFFNLSGVRYPGELISQGYDNPGVNLPGISYPDESIKNPPKHDTPWGITLYCTPALVSGPGRLTK